MKKMVLVFLMAVVAFSAMAQDAKPVTVEAVAVSGGGFGLGAGYVFLLDTMSIEPNLAVITNSGFFGGQIGVRYYALSAVGTGLYADLGYSALVSKVSLQHTISALAGYRFDFFKIMTAHVGVGGKYEFGEITNVFGVGLNIGLGFRF